MAQSRMNSRVKARWLKALLSGKFFQIRQYLRHTSTDLKHFDGSEYEGRPRVGHCCLGVLRACVPELKLQPSSNRDVLSIPSLKKVGLTEDHQDKLAEMNDMGASFKEIAAYIRRHL